MLDASAIEDLAIGSLGLGDGYGDGVTLRALGECVAALCIFAKPVQYDASAGRVVKTDRFYVTGAIACMEIKIDTLAIRRSRDRIFDHVDDCGDGLIKGRAMHGVRLCHRNHAIRARDDWISGESAE